MPTAKNTNALKRPQKTTAPQDHRVRNGVIRREETRRKLLSAALSVFAQKGPDAPLIDDFAAAAGVARGTFYNHFRTTQELLAAVTAELSDEALTVIDKTVVTFRDPIERVACGCLLYMYLAVDNPTWGGFITRVGVRGDAAGKLVDVFLPRDLDLARKAGKATFPTTLAARDLILGCIMRSLQTVLMGKAPRDHLRQSLELAFLGIGVPADVARRVSQMPLSKISTPSGFAFSTLDRSQK